ncbi:MAG: CRISPR-associated helicase Cas3' [Smithellaceae bacterium]|jgi:CRISPR-associated endonuclease/helicase Cas3
MIKQYFAHTLPDKPPADWQPLEQHLKETAEKAKEFACAFGAEDWGYLAGLWHDIGKYSDVFQQRLLATQDADGHIETKPGRPDHSTAGAQHATKTLGQLGKLLAYTIAGHHAGLPDGKTNDQSCLIKRLEKNIPDFTATPDWILNQAISAVTPFTLDQKRFSFQLSFFVRMIYSCLVDADFLNTESFMDAQKSAWRKEYPSLETISNRLFNALDELNTKALQTPINKQRASILQDCMNAAIWKPGLFSLTVPTGGGKTLSSLAFAIKHAIKYNLSRIIYVIPYTSIIEQNAAVFRQILGDEVVLEHHSNFESEEEDHRSRLASENWDAPLIVTTNVQFFESLFSCRSSKCRRIHNITNSVVILDEAQMLPVPLLKPSIEALRELSSNYGTTIVLCTATQPALSSTDSFKNGLDGVREIIPDPTELYEKFKRVKTIRLSKVSDDEIAKKIASINQVLCIVNTRKHARLLYEKIKAVEGTFHLSALMCPAHRTAVLKNIRKTLNSGTCCRVVSTSLVEAGVDIDFPVVIRAAAGIDSIAQAAGRCNREGKLLQNGELYIFTPEEALPPGHFRQAADTTEMVMRQNDDPLSLSAVEAYFRSLYWMKGDKLDMHEILQAITEGNTQGDYPFRYIAEKYKIIENVMDPVIIPWNDKARHIIQELRYSDFPSSAARKAQRFTVQLPQRALAQLLSVGSVERLHEQFNVLINEDLYKDDMGLCPDDPTFHEIENLIA